MRNITIGDELLLGNIDDTNATWLSQTLIQLWGRSDHVSRLGDCISNIHLALNAALETADIAILTGGLGPTQDDMTREAISSFCKRPLVRDAGLATMLDKHFASRNPGYYLSLMKS